MPVIKVNGTVSSVTNAQYQIVKFWETYDFKGQERHRIWTAWFNNNLPAGLQEGDWIELEGSLSTKVSTYTPKDSTETKAIVEHSLNDVAVSQIKAKNETNSAPVVNDETPF
jgi:hypothetical protein